MYNSDTVYTTTTFRPVSISPSTITTDTSSPQRTRKLETPLHFDGGLFSDIRSTDGKLLSKVTVDRVHSSTRHDITDSPHMSESVDWHGNKDYVDDIVKTETITNEDVIKVKFTPVPPELDSLKQWVSPQMPISFSPVKYLKDDYEDLNSYKIVNSLCKNNYLKVSTVDDTDETIENERSPAKRGHSPLANLIVSEHLTKIDGYLQESLKMCSETKVDYGISTPFNSEAEQRVATDIIQDSKSKSDYTNDIKFNDDISLESCQKNKNDTMLFNNSDGESDLVKAKANSVKTKHSGVLNAIYNMPMHYHAAILCFVLIVYNLFYQYIKKNYYGK
ncbi:unnamed protein product [Euphydryas editha]|uniref:Uncharacterized protein n=1 Tax=Euphydryas editha TaxID=104508 RepID=A0AAU9VBC9_EUPED|nr:unnamed protein product [Euphydryas editha]